MRLLELSLEQFRTYHACTVALGSGDIHVLIGENGAGKTNFLEAVSVLSLTRSCRGSDEEDLRTWEKEHYRIRGTVEADDGRTRTLEVVSVAEPRRKRGCFVNDVRTTTGEYVGTLPTVSFLPEDLGLFHGAPAERRRFIDQLLAQVSPEYHVALSTYQQALRQRGAALRALAHGGDRGMLSPWEEQLAAAGAVITMLRLELLQTVNLSLASELTRLGESWNEPHMAYLRATSSAEHAALRAELAERLRATRERDIEAQTTTTGPHRDDWQILGGGRPLPSWASRGQTRVALIALLLLQVAYLEVRRGERPVILLDDVFSELDAAHQEALLASLSGHQMFLSGTALPPAMPAGVTVWNVGSGSLTPA